LEGHGKTGRVRGQPSLISRDRAMDPLGFKAVLPIGVAIFRMTVRTSGRASASPASALRASSTSSS